RREARKLKEWIKEGNRLLIFQGLGWRSSKEKKEKEKSDDGPSVFLQGMYNAPARHFGLRIRKAAGKPRSIVEVSEPGLAGVESISVSGRARWKRPHKEKPTEKKPIVEKVAEEKPAGGKPTEEKTADDWTFPVVDTKGPIVAVKKLGEGKVIAISDATFAANENLAKADNLKLILALLLSDSSHQQVIFDEYHHGNKDAESTWRYVGATLFLWLLVQLLLGFVLLFYSRRARHAGRYQSLDEPTGRSSLEYVESMANIFDACKASSVALDAILRHFLSRLARRTGLRRMDDNALKGIGSRFGGKMGDLATLVSDCRQAAVSEAGPDEALRLANRLGRALEEMEKTRALPLRGRR
ncbi:DUF4350 domain-containing protein, partial [Thermodesulfobacteriota bacterium]